MLLCWGLAGVRRWASGRGVWDRPRTGLGGRRSRAVGAVRTAHAQCRTEVSRTAGTRAGFTRALLGSTSDWAGIERLLAGTSRTEAGRRSRWSSGLRSREGQTAGLGSVWGLRALGQGKGRARVWLSGDAGARLEGWLGGRVRQGWWRRWTSERAEKKKNKGRDRAQ